MIAISESDDARSVLRKESSSREPVSTKPGRFSGVLVDIGVIARIMRPGFSA